MILFLPQEHKIHIFELTCNVLFVKFLYEIIHICTAVVDESEE